MLFRSCNRVNRSLVVRHAGNWIWAGTGVHNGTHLRSLVAIEADGLSSSSPRNIDVIGSSPITCRGRVVHASVTYYSAKSGAGVFAAGTIHWTCALMAVRCSSVSNIPVVRKATENILRAFAEGPAGLKHPSAGRR